MSPFLNTLPESHPDERRLLLNLFSKRVVDEHLVFERERIREALDFVAEAATEWELVDLSCDNRLADGSRAYHSGSYLVDDFCDIGHDMIYGGTDFIRVRDASRGEVDEFEERLRSDGLDAVVYDLLRDAALYGTCGAVVDDQGVLRRVPLPGLLPDWRAESAQVSEWTSYGYVSHLSREEAARRVDAGYYWYEKEGCEAVLRAVGSGRLRVVHWWGVCYGERSGMRRLHYELLCGTDNLMSDLVCGRVRVEEGRPPLFVAHFYQRPGCYGTGLIYRDLSLSWLISDLTSQWLSNSKVTSVAALVVEQDSPAERYLAEAGGIEPGALIPATPGIQGEVRPLELPRYPSAEIAEMLRFLMGQYERRASSVAPSAVFSDRTATGAFLKREVELEGPRTRVGMFVRTLLEPALAMIWERHFGRASEVKVCIGGTDSKLTAKATSLERLLVNAGSVDAALQGDGKRLDVVELLVRYFDALGMNGAERLVLDAGGGGVRNLRNVERGEESGDADVLAERLQVRANPLAVSNE